VETTEINKEELEYIAQRTEIWRQERCGKFTASEFSSLIADCKREMTADELANRPKGVTAKQIVDPTLLADGALTFIDQVAGEILTGQSADSDFLSKEMEWGVLHEPDACKLYAKTMGCVVTEVGSISYQPLKKYVSGSPDGLIDDDGGVEIKCPYTNHNHLKNLRLKTWQDVKENRKEYYWQCIGGLLITGRKYWDFVSYSPNFPGALQIGIVRLNYEDVQKDVRHLAIKLKFAVKRLELILEELNYEEAL